ncbi:hypothetical protein E4U32_008070 [Claviceps aff. humidiphila group G2b]|nr:hypothetical protein E4U32_008070 [Claviceps aff. humidiphila group G2b]
MFANRHIHGGGLLVAGAVAGAAVAPKEEANRFLLLADGLVAEGQIADTFCLDRGSFTRARDDGVMAYKYRGNKSHLESIQQYVFESDWP